MTTKTLTIAEAIATSIEELQAATLTELTSLHSVLASSKQKAATRKLDIVNARIKLLKKEGFVEPEHPEIIQVEKHIDLSEQPELELEEQPELELIENSVKAAPRKIAPKKVVSKKADTIEKEKERRAKAAEKVKQAAEKAATKKVAPKKDEPEEESAPSFARPEDTTPDLSKLSKEELLAYVIEQQELNQKFPKEVKGSKVTYSLSEFESVEDIQKHLIEQPFSLFMFIDERIEPTLTQFLVLFASPEVIVAIDRNKEKNSTLTIKTKDMGAGTLKFNKQDYEYAFYTRN